MAKKENDPEIIETSAMIDDQAAEMQAEEPAAEAEAPAEEIPAEPAAEAEAPAEEIPAEPAAEAEAPAEEAAPQGGTVTVQILGKAPRTCAIQAPMALKEFLKMFTIKVNTKDGWRVYRDGSPIKGDAMVNPGDVLTVGKLNKNG